MNNEFTDGELNSITNLGSNPSFLLIGENDKEGNQIFTPDFVCENMIDLVGIKNILDINKTILEPSSGDGAFTVRILELRLNSIKKDPEYFKKSLIALSTIYSIEMDEDLIKRQRNNIYTTLMKYSNDKGDLPEAYEKIAKKIISTNFIWGQIITGKNMPNVSLGQSIGYYMPNDFGKINKYKFKKEIKFARWTISDNIGDSSFDYEDAEREDEDASSYGGLFAYE